MTPAKKCTGQKVKIRVITFSSYSLITVKKNLYISTHCKCSMAFTLGCYNIKTGFSLADSYH